MEKIEHTIDTLKNIQERLVLKYAYIHLMQYDEIAKKWVFQSVMCIAIVEML